MGDSPPAALASPTVNFTNTSRVTLVVLFIEHIDQIPQPHAFQACKLVIPITIKQFVQQILRHNGNLTELHRLLINPPQIHRRPAGRVAEPSQHKLVPAGDEERKRHAGRPQRLDLGPEVFGQMEGRNEARIYSKHVEFSLV